MSGYVHWPGVTLVLMLVLATTAGFTSVVVLLLLLLLFLCNQHLRTVPVVPHCKKCGFRVLLHLGLHPLSIGPYNYKQKAPSVTILYYSTITGSSFIFGSGHGITLGRVS